MEDEVRDSSDSDTLHDVAPFMPGCCAYAAAPPGQLFTRRAVVVQTAHHGLPYIRLI